MNDPLSGPEPVPPPGRIGPGVGVAAGPTVETSPGDGGGATPGTISGGLPPRPRTFAGRARTFRLREAYRKSARTERTVNAVMAALIVVGAYAIVTERPGDLLPSHRTPGSPSPGPTIVVQFGTASEGPVSCAEGGTAHTESIPWSSSTEPVTTGEFYVRLYEIWDGDNIPDPGAAPAVTPSDLCSGTPPDASALWYVVLSAPNGTNLLTYTETQGWTSVTGGSTVLSIQDGSSLVVVSYDSLAETGRGLEVVGLVGSTEITGSVPL